MSFTPAAIFGACAPIAAAASVAAYGTFLPHSQLWGRVIWRGPADASHVALTFDDGPLPGATDRILDSLGELDAKAIFFVIGRYAVKHPHLVRRMHDEGHVVGNHSYDHASCGFLRGPWFWERQLKRTDDAISQIIGSRPRLFRPPLGIKTPFMCRMRAAGERVTMTWARRAFDGVTTTSQRILDRLAPHSQAGEILALHDGVGPQSRRDPRATVDAIKPLIVGLRERGLEVMRADWMTKIAPYHARERAVERVR
jgi:peptidoglycan/xylan/chitin deacetylase (PgdA/CDA1 family)